MFIRNRKERYEQWSLVTGERQKDTLSLGIAIFDRGRKMRSRGKMRGRKKKRGDGNKERDGRIKRCGMRKKGGVAGGVKKKRTRTVDDMLYVLTKCFYYSF